MKKLFITLLLAIISIGSSMAMDFTETIEVKKIKEGVYSISWYMDSCGFNEYKYNINEWNLEISLYLYDKRWYEEFEAAEDYDTKVSWLKFMRVAYTYGNWHNATYSNDTAWFSETTEDLYAWEKGSMWDYGVKYWDNNKLYSDSSYFVGISFISDHDYWGCCDYENCVTCYSGFFPTKPNAQSIPNTSITPTSQWRKEIRNGEICIVNDNNTAYNIYGAKVK